MRFFFLFIFIGLLSRSLSWSFLVQGDENYFIHQSDNFRIIYTAEQKFLLSDISSKFFEIEKKYQKDFNWRLDRPLTIVLASNRNQISNAFATTFPTNLVVFYPGAYDFLGSAASHNWYDLLLRHEVAHVYQLNVKNRIGTLTSSIFGPSPSIFIPIWPFPFFTSPTAFLPKFIIEGNAVFNESFWDDGGRLQSGYSKSLVNELLTSKVGDLTYLMNNHLSYPYGNDKYILGGYFQSFLANRFGSTNTNSFFSLHAENNFNPFELKSTFSQSFYFSYEQLYNDFVTAFKAENKDYVSCNLEPIVTSKQAVTFSRQNGTINFITTHERNRNRLYNVSLSNSKINFSETRLSNGIPYSFDDNGIEKWWSASTSNWNSEFIQNGLYDEWGHLLKNTENKIILDYNNGHKLWIDASKSFNESVLFLDETFINTIDSRALFSDQGKVAYFKQIGQYRVLFYDQHPLFKIKSRFALIADVKSEKEIYFISNSTYGSTLYCFCSNEIQRVLNYDNILDARIENKTIIFTYQKSDGIAVGITNIASIQKDHYLSFSLIQNLTQDDYSTNYRKISNDTSSEQDKETSKHDSPYESVDNLMFSNFNFSYFSSKRQKTAYNSFSWSDPLSYLELSTTFTLSDQLEYYALSAQYSPYSYTWSLFLSRDLDFYSDSNEKILSNNFELSLQKNLLQKKYFLTQAGLQINKEENHLLTNNTLSLWVKASYSESSLLNYLPRTQLSLTPVFSKTDNSSDTRINVNAIKQMTERSFLSFDYYRSKTEKLKISSIQNIKNISPIKYLPMHYLTGLVYVEDLTQAQVKLTYELDYEKYFYRLPFSIRRLAPFVSLGRDDYSKVFTSSEKEIVIQSQIGLNIEFLLFHLMPIQMEAILGTAKNTENDFKYWNLNFSTQF